MNAAQTLNQSTNIFSRKHGEPICIFNTPSKLPPVGCKLLIKVGDVEMLATRTGYVESKDSKLEYKLESTGEVISGFFWWSYP